MRIPTRSDAQRRPSAALIATLGLSLVALACAAGIVWGSVAVGPSSVFTVLGHRIFGIGNEPSDALADMIVWRLRVPRVLAAALVGAALALAGAALQGLVRNPLADPYTLGVSAGASLAAVVVMSSVSAVWIRNIGVPAAALLGAAGALLCVLALAYTRGTATGSRIVLAGVGVGQVAMAATSLVQLKSQPGEIRGILFWMMGSVAGVQSLDELAIPAVIALVCTVWLLLHARNLNLLSMGDDDARALGVHVERTRLELIIIIAALTGLAVAVAGGVGFVGLIIPHCVRFFTGPDYRRLLPAALLFGAAFLVLIDLATRTIDIPNEYPLTIFTAALGGPFFLWLLRRSTNGGAL